MILTSHRALPLIEKPQAGIEHRRVETDNFRLISSPAIEVDSNSTVEPFCGIMPRSKYGLSFAGDSSKSVSLV